MSTTNILYPTSCSNRFGFELGNQNFPVFNGNCSDDVNQLEKDEFNYKENIPLSKSILIFNNSTIKLKI